MFSFATFIDQESFQQPSLNGFENYVEIHLMNFPNIEKKLFYGSLIWYFLVILFSDYGKNQ